MIGDNWSRRLACRIEPSDGTGLVLLADARDYVLGISEDRQQRQAWQHAARLMMEAAAGGPIEAASEQIERALFLDAMLTIA